MREHWHPVRKRYKPELFTRDRNFHNDIVIDVIGQKFTLEKTLPSLILKAQTICFSWLLISCFHTQYSRNKRAMMIISKILESLLFSFCLMARKTPHYSFSKMCLKNRFNFIVNSLKLLYDLEGLVVYATTNRALKTRNLDT